MAVCQPRITQHAVRFGLDHLEGWVAANREMMARRHDLFRLEFMRPGNPFQLAASGAFFAWVRHPWAGLSGRQAARRLVDEAAILSLPGEVFGPGLEGVSASGIRQYSRRGDPRGGGAFPGDGGIMQIYRQGCYVQFSYVKEPASFSGCGLFDVRATVDDAY